MSSVLPSWVSSIVRCPVTGAMLELEGGEFVAVEGAEPRLAYPISEGIPVLLANEARPAKSAA